MDKIASYEDVLKNNVEELTSYDKVSIEDYTNYRNELKEIFASTTEDNSITSSFIVDGDVCRHTLTVKFADNNEEISKHKEFSYDDNFKNEFLSPLINDYFMNNSILSADLEVLDEDKSNFVTRTNTNDSINIVNIDIDFANSLMDLRKNCELVKEPEKSLMKTNNKGISNYLVLILTVLAIGMALVGTIVFTISNR